jgi:hypothetical protein
MVMRVARDHRHGRVIDRSSMMIRAALGRGSRDSATRG